jgi:hypothetical protein
MYQLTPARELGKLMGDFLHREQSLGEIRGLSRLDALLKQRREELEVKLGMKRNEGQELDEQQSNE